MTRHTKATTIEGWSKAFDDIHAEPLPSPWPLSKAQKPIWNEIIARRARDEWQAIDLHFAWELAGVLVTLHEEERRLDAEGSIFQSEAGPKTNPRAAIVQQLSQRSRWLAIYLRVHPASEGRDPGITRSGRSAERKVRDTIGDLDPGKFLPRQ